MLKIEASKITLADLRVVPFGCTAGNSVGAARHSGRSAVVA